MNTEGTQITPLAAAHIPAAAAIAATAQDPWREADFAAALQDKTRQVFCLWRGDFLAGFAAFRLLRPDAELELIATNPTMRGQGHAHTLLCHGLAAMQSDGAARCLLEVRAGNTAAVALYEKSGFVPLATRPRMYAHPPEDGVLMEILL